MLGLVDAMYQCGQWLRGCECCEAARRAGRLESCPWAGCRAPRLAERIDELVNALDLYRLRLRPDSDLHMAATRVLADIRVKMAWVNELPYLIWKARLEMSIYHMWVARQEVGTRDRVWWGLIGG